ncbi:MAG: dCTP deaminase [Microcystaceae cyanobacterium]
MIQNDAWIAEKALEGMINPFVPYLVRDGVLSYGLGSFGYDIRLSEHQFMVFSPLAGLYDHPIDPKCFNVATLETSVITMSHDGQYFILPPHSYGLGVSVEKIKMPPNVTGVCVGKSTYARCGVIANITPIEAGWEGYITLEFSNSSSLPVRLYANEGVVQLLFFEGTTPSLSYGDRKYQNQANEITFARI